MTSDEAKAVKKATMLMPADVWAVPLPASAADVAVGELPPVVLDMLAGVCRVGRRRGRGEGRGDERVLCTYILRVWLGMKDVNML